MDRGRDSSETFFNFRNGRGGESQSLLERNILQDWLSRRMMKLHQRRGNEGNSGRRNAARKASQIELVLEGDN